MTIKKKIVAAFLVILTCLFLYFCTKIILVDRFTEIEAMRTQRNVERALSVLSFTLSTLDYTAADWAGWDDTYEFVEDANDNFVRTNLEDITFVKLRLNLMLFINSTGSIVYGKGFDLKAQKGVPIPDITKENLSADSPLLRQSDIESSAKGIVVLPEGPMLVASRPILTGQNKGAIRGSLIMGRYLDFVEIRRMAELIHLSLSVHHLEDFKISPDLRAELFNSPDEKPIAVRPVGEDLIAGYTLLKDIYGNPGLVLKVEMPREIYSQSKTSMLYSGLLILGIGLMLWVLIFLFLENSERRVAEEKLRESDALFHTMADNAPVLLWMSDTDALCIFFNQVWLDFTGRAMEQEIGSGWVEGVHPEDLGQCLSTYMSAFDQRQKFEMEYRLRCADGGYRWIYDKGIPRFLPDGSFAGYIGSAIDITGRKRIEEQMQYCLAVEEAVAYASSLFISPGGADLNEVLKVLGQAVYADEAYTFDLRDNGSRMANTHYWCNPEREIRIDCIQNIDTASFAWWMNKLERSEDIIMPDVNDLPPAASSEKKIIQSGGIRSLLAVPVHSPVGELSGFMWFVCTEKCREWSSGDIRALRVIAKMVGIYQEQKRAEGALRRSEVYFRSLIENALDLIVILNSDGIIIYVSPSVARVLGYEPENLIGRNSFETVHPADKMEVIGAFNEIIQKPYITRKKEFRFRHKDGTWRILEAVGKNLVDVPAVAGVVVNCRDMTERRRAEEVLRESEERFRIAFEYAATGMALVGSDGSWLQVNHSLCEILGFSEQELLSMNFQEITHPEDLNIDSFFMRKMLGGELRTSQFEKRYFHKQGHTVWVYLSASKVSDEQGKPLYFIAQIQDVTMRKRIEANLVEARKKAERSERMASLGTMAAGIAHEINQPLNSLKIIVDGILFWDEKGKTFDSMEIIGKVKEISAQADRINNIIKRIRSFVRSENQTKLTPCSVNEAVEGALDMLGGQLSSLGIQVKKSNPGTILPVRGEKYRLEEVVINLLVNAMQALDAIDKEDKEILIATSVEKNVILEISDNATGVCEEFRDKIFEPFFTTKEVGDGMGLGLSIVHSIVTSFNGQVSVMTNEKGGATFRVELPVFEL